jgi:hypothetical protein
MTPERLWCLNGRIYAVCGLCGQIVRFDKPFIGSWHICVTDEEARNPVIQQRVAELRLRNIALLEVTRVGP